MQLLKTQVNYISLIYLSIDLAEAYHMKGKVNQAKGDFARAIPDFTMAIKLDSAADADTKSEKIAEHWNYCGQCYLELGQYEDAQRHFESAIKKNKTNGLFYYNRAQVKAKLDKLEEAVLDYAQALAQNMTSPEYIFNSNFNRGNCLRRLGRLDESIDDLKKAVSIKPENPSAHNNLGLSHFEKEEYEEALNEFTKAIGLKPHGLHYNNRGLALYHIGNLQDAKKDFDAALEKSNDDPFIYFNRGNVYMNLGEF
jgi:tetratricopeptide (TPR) repeat protein